MTNLYDFLRRILSDLRDQPSGNVFVSGEDRAWIEQFLCEPDVLIDFRARATGQVVGGQPVYETNYAIAGDGVDVFSLLAEAALANQKFADLVRGTAGFIAEHVPACPLCMEAANQFYDTAVDDRTWEFKPLNHAQ